MAASPVDEDRRLDLIDDLAVAAFATDVEGRVIRYNHAATVLWGRMPPPGTRWSGALRLLTADGAVLDPAASPAALTLREGRPPEVSGMLFAERPDGSRVPFLPRPSMLHGADGEITGALELMLEPHASAPIDLAVVRQAAIVTSASDSIVGQSLEGRITSWNDAATRMFGWRPEEVIGQPILRLIPPERRHEEDMAVLMLKRGQRPDPYATERLARDGRRIRVSLSISPIRDAAGRLIAVAKIAREMRTPETDAEPGRELVEQLNHRVRNTLATIQAFATQSLQLNSSPEDFVRSFAGRVQTLARMHELLLAGDMAGADLRTIVRSELAAESSGLRVAIDGPQVALEARVAVQMALALHELADNARRHGALAAGAGRVTVGWRIEANRDEMHLVLDWHERAPGRRSEPGPEAGFLLIERGLAVTGGSAVLRDEPDGFAWEIRLPLPGLPAALPGDASRRQDDAPYAGQTVSLEGCRVLVVEEEPLIALEIEAELVAAGATVLGPVGDMAAAARLIETEPLDAALLDATLAGEPVGALAAALEVRAIPFAFASGRGRSGLPEGFGHQPLLGKPFSAAELVALIRTLVSPSDGLGVVPLRRRE